MTRPLQPRGQRGPRRRGVRLLRRLALIFLLFSGLVWLLNSSHLADPIAPGPWLLAHRGLGQTFSMEGITGETDTSKRIFPPEHAYLENTIPSMEAAFRMGADVVELDIHPTTDGQFAVFHDWILEYRTEGQGVTREFPLDYLQTLDVGYGYTADGGKTYPFRGKGVGMMPSLAQVLGRFPDESFLIHIKSNDPEEGRLLAKFLEHLPATRLNSLTVYGGDRPVAALAAETPELRTMSRGSLKRSLLRYIALGWTGYVPKSCRSTQVHIPESAAPWIWGWPNRFLQRMEAANTRVVLVAGSGRFSEGFDSEQDLDRIPAGYSGGIWTNRIDRIGPLLER